MVEENTSRGTSYNKDITVEDVFAQYLQKAKNTLKERSYITEESSVKKVREYLEMRGLTYARLVTPVTVQEFISYRKVTLTHLHKPPSNYTINHNILSLKRAFTLAYNNGLIAKNPLDSVERIRFDKEDTPRILSREDVAIIEEIAKGRVIEGVVFLLVRTGLRLRELIALEVNDICLEKNVIIVRSRKAKSRRTRYVPVVGKVRDFLLGLVGDAQECGREVLFVNSKGNRLEANNVWQRFRYVLRKAEERGVDIRGVNVHTLRKTFISYMIMSGQDPAKVMRIVGHRNWETMRKYLYLQEDYLRDIPEIF